MRARLCASSLNLFSSADIRVLLLSNYSKTLTLQTLEQLVGDGERIRGRFIFAGDFDFLRQLSDCRSKVGILRVDFNAIGRVEGSDEQVTRHARVAQGSRRTQDYKM